ncbi:sulfate ABC transporter, permease protein CysT [Thermobacillus composti KWC4]|jgi:sulfate/thiosulfate transport system permease protein|uniref:Sulfate transport system permease protein CysT n=1 Tax=Thermobacillus composti (strain DSM 18247 / JCM 13945 / KWC4) TaxID=717605 RepID=L0EGR0_THECK|nr:sulfate ABC transporter permease subunit CysT [Thermobacillus composti]AGA58824.1 sulfate ABC transporter, permease protein CysT [Thermobacillus composti KWC4]REJ17733.1 MAG: sulfate ABC transporter permease subunit CysT [Paenibacillaceae bacterium]
MKGSRKASVLPGFGLSLGFTVLYLSLIVIIPLASVLIKTAGMSFSEFWAAVTNARVLAAYKLSFLTAFFAAAVNAVFGLLVAWVLVRYRFPGKRLIDSIVDLPFALPTAVAGIALTSIYAPTGWVGSLLEPLGLKIAYTPIGITIALVFIGLPFVVRTVQPVLQDLDKDVEEAAVMLGAYRWRTFRRVILPELIPPLLTGFALAFARGIGEYGSVVFISGNMPMRTEIAPLLIMTKLEQFDYAGATAIALVMLVISFSLLLLINYMQWRYSRRVQAG